MVENKSDMKLTTEGLKELYQQRTANLTRRKAECLTEETMFQAATGQLSRQEREQVADHLVACSDCSQEYRLIISLKSWTNQAISPPDTQSPQEKANGKLTGWKALLQTVWGKLVWEPRWRVAAVASVGAITIAVSLHLWRDVHPVNEAREMDRGMASTAGVIDPPNRAILVGPPRQFSWSAVESAENYRVALYDLESTAVWESAPVTVTSVEIPEPIREKLLGGQPYYWRVVTRVGIELRQSELFQFVISP